MNFFKKNDSEKNPGDNKSVNQHSLAYRDSAAYRLSGFQILLIILFISSICLFLLLDLKITFIILIAFLTIIYFADLLFNLFLIHKSFSKNPEMIVSKKELESKKNWPTYTILCPLYKEGNVLSQFVSAMDKLDYPKKNLQILLLLEEDDKETIERAGLLQLPSNFEIIIVPDSNPKTKPKACNYGLEKAKGEFVVIFDAEDVPESDQLKKAVVAFEKSDEKTICVQAKLNFYNPKQNILTRAFTAEYSVWFDLVLVGLQAINAPIPLGGTSNHFKTTSLKKLGGWDPFNVTEDCDLGIRLVKQNFRTVILDSVTHEEANSNLWNWFKQRTRWVKGYIQTYLVHMRRPQDFINQWSQPHVLTFQLVVGGKVLSMLINPVMWILTILYFIFRSQIGKSIESVFPSPVLYMSFFSLIVGNFLYVYYYMIGAAKRKQYDLIKYVIFVPLYWLGMSAASYRAIFDFAVRPHYWFKTSHGLHIGNKNADSQAKDILGKELINPKFV